MMDTQTKLPAKLAEIVEDFQMSTGREKIDMLLGYSQDMPPLPERLQADHEQMDFVHECMTPVYVQAEMEDGGLHFYFDVPPASPTVRGLAAILAAGADGATPQEVLSIPANFYLAMGLQELITQQRLNGFTAILGHMKRLAAGQLEKDGSEG
jgi:cysteine desulfuration protein SufE